MIDQSLAMIVTSVGKKGLLFSNRWQEADNIQINAAHEFVVRANASRLVLKLAQFFVHQRVDEVILRRVGPTKTSDILHERKLARNQLVEIAGHHRHLAALVADQQAVLSHRGNLLVRGREFREVGDVADGPVVEMGPRYDLLT